MSASLPEEQALETEAQTPPPPLGRFARTFSALRRRRAG